MKSLAFLFFQSGYSAVLGLATNLIITALAAKEVFGIYAATLATIAIFNYLSDIGLAGALIQKRHVEDRDLSTVFTVQQIMISVLVIIGYSATPWVLSFYKLPAEAIYLYWSILAGFFISSLKTIPSVLLERSVHFAGIVRVQIIENTVFYLVVSVGIVAGLGLYSFALGIIIRSTLGTIIMYRRSPWRPRVQIHPPALRELLSFGVPFQTNSILALVKDELMVVFLGRTLGFQGLAEIMWAKKWAEAPIRIIMDNVSKLLFPLLSRLQDDRARLRRTITATIWLQTAVLAPSILVVGVSVPALVRILPQYHKWEDALPIFYIFCASAFFSTLSTPFMNIFNALRMPKVPLVFMIFWTVSTWIFVPWSTRTFGPIGFAYVQFALSCSFIVVMFYARQLLGLKYLALHEVSQDINSLTTPLLVRIRRLSKGAPEPTQYQDDKLE